ncbi:MAG: class I SAM-dependent RNA methyltransferase [Acidobacteria bacterium]|nr:class I SAM-dependent RNA methyltransferase [Acidobacteriota bacterium]
MPRVRVEKLVYQGHGLTFHDGKAVFIRRAAPQDVADIRIVQSRKNYDLAMIETLVEKSPERVDPPCRFFKLGCGGCQWQHLRYTTQLEWKKQIFLEFLQRNHFSQPFPPLTIYPSEPFGYRTRFSFHLVASGKAALFREHTHELIPVDHCRLLPEPMNELLTRLQSRSWLAGCDSFQIWMDDTGQLGLEMFPPLSEAFLAAARREMPGLKLLHPSSSDWMQFGIQRIQFRISGQGFFQTNRFLNSTLNEIVCRSLGGGARLLDLYSGVGFFTLPLCFQFGDVVGVEENERACAEAVDNARINELDNVKFVAADVNSYLETTTEIFDCVLADPPRAGLSKKVIHWILKSKPERIAYVSCDPTTLVRDIQWLSAAYQVQQFSILDLFPQTFHFEVLAQLYRRRDARSDP